MKRKHMIALLLSTVTVLGMSMSAFAAENVVVEESVQEETVAAVVSEESAEISWTYEENDDGTVTLTGYSGEEPTGDIVIPAELDGMGVTSIDSCAFDYCDSLTGVKIPENVTSIGYNAFYNCNSLTKVEIPESLTSIGSDVFNECPNLETAGPIGSGSNIEFGWTTDIPEAAFNGCSSLTAIEIPKNVKDIEWGTFRNCSSLKSVILLESVEDNTGRWYYIDSDAFSGCSSLETIIIPEGIRRIGSSAFSGCSSLKSIVLPDSLESIYSTAFYKCSSLENIIIPQNVSTIGRDAFRGCKKLTNIRFEGSAPDINVYAFYNVTASAAYPVGDATWTEEVRKNYGGNLTWESYGTELAGWNYENGSWYFYENGNRAVSWKYIDGQWYYFDTSGIMATGWRQISGKWYYFYSSGAMAANTRIDGYYINSSGVWVS